MVYLHCRTPTQIPTRIPTPNPRATLYCTETVPIAWTHTWIPILNCYCVHFGWTSIPGLGSESVSSNVNKPLAKIAKNGRITHFLASLKLLPRTLLRSGQCFTEIIWSNISRSIVPSYIVGIVKTLIDPRLFVLRVAPPTSSWWREIPRRHLVRH